jgi:hypothetical protein
LLNGALFLGSYFLYNHVVRPVVQLSSLLIINSITIVSGKDDNLLWMENATAAVDLVVTTVYHVDNSMWVDVTSCFGYTPYMHSVSSSTPNGTKRLRISPTSYSRSIINVYRHVAW